MLGYLSSWMSLGACEIKTAEKIVRSAGPGRTFFIPPEQDDERRRAIWKEVGAETRLYDPAKDGPYHMPRGELERASPTLPFLTTVHCAWVRAPLVGSGGTFWYFCFFGLTVELGYSVRRAS